MIIVVKWINCPGYQLSHKNERTTCTYRFVYHNADSPVCQGRSIHISNNIEMSISDVFLQVCVLALTQLTNWQDHKHNNKPVSCAYRLWECQDSHDSFLQGACHMLLWSRSIQNLPDLVALTFCGLQITGKMLSWQTNSTFCKASSPLRICPIF